MGLIEARERETRQRPGEGLYDIRSRLPRIRVVRIPRLDILAAGKINYLLHKNASGSFPGFLSGICQHGYRLSWRRSHGSYHMKVNM
jgi:hypothetical protein